MVDATIASSNYTTLSTDMQFGRNDEHQTLAETFGALDDNLDKVLDIHTVQPLIAPLPEREQTILALRFFDNMTQTEIANRIGCSQMHVSRYSPSSISTTSCATLLSFTSCGAGGRCRAGWSPLEIRV